MTRVDKIVRRMRNNPIYIKRFLALIDSMETDNGR